MLVQILDADYVMLENKPLLRIYGKTEKGDSACVFYSGFMPYFYVDEVPEWLKKDPQVFSIEPVERVYPMFYRTDKMKLFKVTIHDPSRTPELRDKVIEGGGTAYEADILFKYRFMADAGIGSLMWLDIKGASSANTSTVRTKTKFEVKGINIMDKVANSDFRSLALDIECVAENQGEVPTAERDPIIMISLVFSEEYNGKKEMVISYRPGSNVQSYNDENGMLKGLIDIINDFDPDFIVGYNINNFDLPYIIERMQRLKIPAMFTRATDKSAWTKKLAMGYRNNVLGRIIADPFALIKKDFSFKRYSLENVASELLGEHKEDVKYSEMEKLWKGDQKGYDRLVSYCLTDARLAMRLFGEFNLLDKYIGISRICCLFLQDVLDGGETQRIEHYLMREFNRNGYIFPLKPSQEEMAERDNQRKVGLKGGFVLDPEPGMHENVAVMDFKSMYPSLIRTYNICPTTLVGPDGPKFTEDEISKSPEGGSFVKPEIRKGIVPYILENLMNERANVKKRLKKATKDGNAAEVRELNTKQLGIKIMANAFYGHMGYPRARIYNMDVANAITSWGRQTIQKTKDIIEKDYGYKVIYGDTDSVMVELDKVFDNKKIAEVGNKISEEITKNLPGIMELEFEKIFKRFLPLAKKRYAAWAFIPKGGGEWVEKIDMKGIETVRRDWCDLSSETLRNVIDIILKENDRERAVQYFQNIAKSLGEGNIPMDKLVVTKTLTKRPESYPGVQPHAEVAKKMTQRNPADAPSVGDRISYVIVKGTQLLSYRAEDPEYVTEKGLHLDSIYYMENQLLPPVERIFEALNVTKSELMGKGKQMNLFSMMGKQASKKAKPEIPVADIIGFSCEECGRPYRRPTLTGYCECGGKILFSSAKGNADVVKNPS
ncbi:MAG: ribonuclease H-like domain-containing protein [Candidatus Aenigmarchaeota archaeon]|nr:ribonuclease H-like domain-containing protein [Candidatus Aenigmarchaeota archaeon]